MTTIHTFDSTGEAYNASQCSDEIKDGDILAVPSEHCVGILIQAWPTAISAQSGEFHRPVGRETFDGYDLDLAFKVLNEQEGYAS